MNCRAAAAEKKQIIRFPRVLKSKKGLFALASLLVVLISLFLVSSRKSLPASRPGEQAELLAARVEASVGKDGWERLGAIAFYFVPGGRAHFVDFKRGFVEVAFAQSSNQYLVQYAKDGRGLVFKNRKRVDGQEASDSIQQALKFHINDMYWLNPFVQMRSPGAVRKITEDGDLMVHYPEGGITPGDTYVIHIGPDGLPDRWNLWVKVLPLKGMQFTFEDWKEIAPGVRVSLMHRSFFKDVELREVRTFSSYPGTENKDRFAELVEMIK